MLEEPSGLGSLHCCLLYPSCNEHPPSRSFRLSMGFIKWGSFSFSPHSGWWHLIFVHLDQQHWLTIVTLVLSNNLGMLCRILSRLTGMWDETIWTYVAMEALNACGNVIDLFTLWQEFKAGVRFAYRNADSERDIEPSWDEGGGKVASQTVAVPCK